VSVLCVCVYAGVCVFVCGVWCVCFFCVCVRGFSRVFLCVRECTV